MNATELANKLDEYNKDGMPVLVVSQAVDMLRQQQAEIEKLKHDYDLDVKILMNQLKKAQEK